MNEYGLPNFEEISKALDCIPSDERDLWVKMCFAIKTAFPDEQGFMLFDAWSSKAPNYDANVVKSTWKNAKSSGKVNYSSIFYEAKQRGYSTTAQHDDIPAPSEEYLAKQAQIREQQEKQAKEAEASNRKQAKDKAARMWQAALTDGESGYLKRKQVGAHGVKFFTDGRVLVPVINPADGELCNLQTIHGKTLEGSPTNKFFLKGGLLKGCYHVIGDIGQSETIIIAEGYATAATIYEASGLPVVVAFNSNNLSAVAIAIRKQWPNKLIYIAGDNDKAHKGKNAGVDAARAAGKAINAGWFVPDGLLDNESDFNDLALRLGMDAVKNQITGFLSGVSHTEASPAVKTPATDKGITDKVTHEPNSNNRYILKDEAVYFCGVDSKGNSLNPAYVCGYLVVQGRTHNKDGSGWGYLLEFHNHDKRLIKYVMPSEYLYGDGAKLAALLADMGLDIDVKTATRQRLKEYISMLAKEAHERVIVADAIGWFDDVFVLPLETIGEGKKAVIYDPLLSTGNNFNVSGSVTDWQSNVAAYCVGNSRLVFSVSCAFAGLLLKHSFMEPGGFNILGASSTGKSTALDVACSVFGGTDFKKQWRATDNALETIASLHSDTLLALDEMKQLDSKAAGTCAYMLANGRGKERAGKHGDGVRKVLTWRLLFLSSGELSMADLMREAGHRTYAGQQVRLPDVLADAGANMGLFEYLHGVPSPREFADRLKANVRKYYGSAGIAFIRHLVTNITTLESRIKQGIADILKGWLSPGISGQVERVASRFALVAIGGEMATEAGLTGWSKGEAIKGVHACFKSWLDNRGGAGDLEEMAILQQVRQFIAEHGDSRFQWVHRANDTHAARVINRAGYRLWITEDGERVSNRTDQYVNYGEDKPPAYENSSCEYLVLADVFKNEICKGLDYKLAQKVLHEKGFLRAGTEGNKTRYTRKERLPALGTARVYCILPTLLESED